MKLRKRKVPTINKYIPSKECKHCDLCHGTRGGIRGNNQIIDGRRVCDYCHAYFAKAAERAKKYIETNGVKFVEHQLIKIEAAC